MSTRCQIEFYDGNPTDGAEPAARIYKHSDGYPKGILPMLKYVERILRRNIPSFGPRLEDPEWAAAEFVTQFRLPSNWSDPVEPGGAPLADNTKRCPLSRYRGNIYITQRIHQDIEYLYRIECLPEKWVIRVYTPRFDANHGIIGFEERS